MYTFFGTSAAVSAQTKPGTFSASLKSIPLIRACTSGLRTIFRWSIPG